MAQPEQALEQNGFVGAVSGMSLADIVQVKGTNRYSGCLVVEHLGHIGMVFFRDGDIIHAEQGELSGEEAFYSIMGWVGGVFRSEPKLATTSKTIDQALGFLILEALRRMDESHYSRPAAKRVDSRPFREDTGMSDINSKLKAISGVEYAVVITKDGQTVDDTSAKGEVLGGYALYLGLFASQISSQFGIGGLKSVTVQGSDNHIFLFDSKRHHLCVSTDASMPVNTFESEIKRALAEK